MFLFKFWDRAPKTTICRATPSFSFIISDHLFLLIKFYWNATSLIYLNTVYDCFYAITTGLSGCDKKHVIYKGEKIFALWPLTEKVWWSLVQSHSVTEEIKHFPNPASCLPTHEASEIGYSSNPGQAWQPDQVPNQSQLFPLKANVLVTEEIYLEIYSGAFLFCIFSCFHSIQPVKR